MGKETSAFWSRDHSHRTGRTLLERAAHGRFPVFLASISSPSLPQHHRSICSTLPDSAERSSDRTAVTAGASGVTFDAPEACSLISAPDAAVRRPDTGRTRLRDAEQRGTERGERWPLRRSCSWINSATCSCSSIRQTVLRLLRNLGQDSIASTAFTGDAHSTFSWRPMRQERRYTRRLRALLRPIETSTNPAEL